MTQTRPITKYTLHLQLPRDTTWCGGFQSKSWLALSTSSVVGWSTFVMVRERVLVRVHTHKHSYSQTHTHDTNTSVAHRQAFVAGVCMPVSVFVNID